MTPNASLLARQDLFLCAAPQGFSARVQGFGV